MKNKQALEVLTLAESTRTLSSARISSFDLSTTLLLKPQLNQEYLNSLS